MVREEEAAAAAPSAAASAVERRVLGAHGKVPDDAAAGRLLRSDEHS
jgi:hypothetical protein